MINLMTSIGILFSLKNMFLIHGAEVFAHIAFFIEGPRNFGYFFASLQIPKRSSTIEVSFSKLI